MGTPPAGESKSAVTAKRCAKKRYVVVLDFLEAKVDGSGKLEMAGKPHFLCVPWRTVQHGGFACEGSRGYHQDCVIAFVTGRLIATSEEKHLSALTDFAAFRDFRADLVKCRGDLKANK